jgi:hypothetical protein
MVAARKAVVIIEWLLVGFFALILTLGLLDLPSAWHGQPCSVQPSSGCYPWGGTEGPASGLWNYASKRIYLVSSVFDAILSCAVLVSAFVLPQGQRIFALLIGGALFYLSGFFLPLVV